MPEGTLIIHSKMIIILQNPAFLISRSPNLISFLLTSSRRLPQFTLSARSQVHWAWRAPTSLPSGRLCPAAAPSQPRGAYSTAIPRDRRGLHSAEATTWKKVSGTSLSTSIMRARALSDGPSSLLKYTLPTQTIKSI